MLASLTYTRQLKQTILGKKRPRRSLLKGGEKFAGIPSKFFNIPRPRARISIPAYRPCSHTCIHGVASRASAINHSAVRIELTKSAKMERPEGPKPEAVSASADSDAGISNGARLPLKFPRLDSSRAYQGKRRPGESKATSRDSATTPGDDTRRRHPATTPGDDTRRRHPATTPDETRVDVAQRAPLVFPFTHSAAASSGSSGTKTRGTHLGERDVSLCVCVCVCVCERERERERERARGFGPKAWGKRFDYDPVKPPFSGSPGVARLETRTGSPRLDDSSFLPLF
jgi:hypothetical protein